MPLHCNDEWSSFCIVCKRPLPSRALNCYKNLIFFIDFSRKIRNFIFPQNLEFWTFGEFWDIYKKTRAEISRKTHRRMPRDLSYETDSGPKTKTENQPFSGPLKKLNNFSRLPKRNWVLIGLDFQNMCCNDLHQTGHELAFDESKKAVGQNYKTS